MTFTHALATNNYGPLRLIVDPDPANGTHTTISSALAAASPLDIIGIRPGTYTEDIDLIDDITLVSLIDRGNGAGVDPVVIQGQITFTGGGNANLEGIVFQSNGAALISVSGALATYFSFRGCVFTNESTFPVVSCNNANATLVFDNCNLFSGDASTPIFTITSCSSISFYNNSQQFNAATASTIAAGNIGFRYSTWASPITTSGTAGFLAHYSRFLQSSNATITWGGSGTHQSYYCLYAGGTASAITVNTTALFLGNKVSSSNTNALTGSGSLSFDLISYYGSSSGNNVNTQTLLATQPALGIVVQEVRSSTVATQTIATTIPADDTIPQITEGGEVLTAAITPTNANNILKIEATVNYGSGSGNDVFIGIWQDATADCLSGQWTYVSAANQKRSIPLTYFMTAGTTSSTTFRLRAGQAAGNAYINSLAGGRQYGGILFTSLRVQEIEV